MERGAVVADETINNDVITDPLLNPDYREISEPLTPQATQTNTESRYTPQNTRFNESYTDRKQPSLQANLSQFNGNKPDKKQGFSLPSNPLMVFYNGLKSELLKKPVSLLKQGTETNQQESNIIRSTDNVNDENMGLCEYPPCNNSFIKRVSWKRHCSDECRVKNWELKNERKLRLKAGQGAKS